MYRFGISEKTGCAAAFLASAEISGVMWTQASGGLDALLIMPDGIAGHAAPTLITPPDKSSDARQLITYGLGSKETVTYSGLCEDACAVSLQRELVTLAGRRLERQEIPLPFGPGRHAEALLAVCAAILAAGWPPEGIHDLFQAKQFYRC